MKTTVCKLVNMLEMLNYTVTELPKTNIMPNRRFSFLRIMEKTRSTSEQGLFTPVLECPCPLNLQCTQAKRSFLL